MSPQLAYLVANLMKGVVQNGTGRYARRLGRPLAGKTGTSNDNRDLWFIGYTPDLVAGAWMGYDDFSSLGRKDWTGGSTVVPWWTDIMADVLKDLPKRDFPVPPGIKFAAIDSKTGLRFGPRCPRRNRILEAFLDGTVPKYCTIDHDLPLEPQLAALPAVGPSAPAQPAGPASISTVAAVAPAPPPGVVVSSAVPATDAPPPLPSDEELLKGEPSDKDGEPDGLE